MANRSPTWNSGLAQRSSRRSYIWLERVVQPNLSYRYRHMWPPTKVARHRYGITIHNSTSRPLIRGSPAPSHVLRRSERLQADLLLGRPRPRQLQCALEIARGRLGQDGADGVEHGHVRRARIRQGMVQELDGRPVLGEQAQAEVQVRGGGELTDHA